MTDYLDIIEYNDTIPFIPPITCGKVIKVYDGDTLTLASKLPYDGCPIYHGFVSQLILLFFACT